MTEYLPVESACAVTLCDYSGGCFRVPLLLLLQMLKLLIHSIHTMIDRKLNLGLFASLALCTTGAQAAGSAPKSKKGEPNKPNDVIILDDDLGFGDIACNGSFQTISTPNVDRLAAQGVRFANAHATAATSTPARYSILTGEYAWREPGTGVAPGDAAMIVTPQHQTLPAMMQRAGYTTAAVGKWPWGWATRPANRTGTVWLLPV